MRTDASARNALTHTERVRARLPCHPVILSTQLPRRHFVTLLAAAALAGGCRPGWDALGASPSQAQANGIAFTDALHRRYTQVQRAPSYAAARAKIGKRTLAPSGIFDDTTTWTSRPDARTRVLMAEGSVTQDGHYRFTPRESAPMPDRLADARHFTELTKLAGDGEYQWRASVDFAVGSLTPTDWGNAFRGLLGSAERRSDDDLRADVRSTLPRTTAALGRMFSLDTLRGQRQADGSTVVTVVTRVRPERLQVQFPLYAKFIAKYVSPTAFHIVLRDTKRTRWLDISAAPRGILVRLRVLNGGLVPLDGVTAPMPDTLRVTMDVSTKFSIFTIGVREMHGTLAFVRAPSERGWAMRFDKPPEWQLPLFAASMLRSPLRRPFEQGGITTKLSFRTGTDSQTWISREFRTAVQESAVTRFLGGLGGAAFSEFDGPAEQEENRFNAALFQAMREDLRALRYGSVPQPTRHVGP